MGTSRLGVAAFWLANPTAGANTVEVSFSGVVEWTFGIAATFTGAHQTELDSVAEGTAATADQITVAITIANANAHIFAVCVSNSSPGITTSGTEVLDGAAGSDDFFGCQRAGPLSAGSNNVTFSDGDANQNWAMVILGIKDAAGGGAVYNPIPTIYQYMARSRGPFR
jgi:hypothetical protein